jgi:hypothetical protein
MHSCCSLGGLLHTNLEFHLYGGGMKLDSLALAFGHRGFEVCSQRAHNIGETDFSHVASTPRVTYGLIVSWRSTGTDPLYADLANAHRWIRHFSRVRASHWGTDPSAARMAWRPVRPRAADTSRRPAENLAPPYGPNIPLVDAYSIAGFNVGNRLGSFQNSHITNRLDYIFVSQALAGLVTGGGLERHGLWGTPTNKNAPNPLTYWEIYGDLTRAEEAASDHAAIFVDINI